MKLFVRVALGALTVAAGLVFAPATASAGETGTIYGKNACEAVERQYERAGYNARCNHIHGEQYYVFYTPRSSGMPSTGSFGSS